MVVMATGFVCVLLRKGLLIITRCGGGVAATGSAATVSISRLCVLLMGIGIVFIPKHYSSYFNDLPFSFFIIYYERIKYETFAFY